MGVPQLVYNGKSHLEMDENWGYPHDLGNLQRCQDEVVLEGEAALSSSAMVGMNACEKLISECMMVLYLTICYCMLLDVILITVYL